jgi:hypothetical protein
LPALGSGSNMWAGLGWAGLNGLVVIAWRWLNMSAWLSLLCSAWLMARRLASRGL